MLEQTRKHAWTDKQACLGRCKSNDVYLFAGTVSISAQIEAAVKACEAETARVGQDYYSALSASSPTAAKGPAAGKSPAPAKGKSAKEELTAPAEVTPVDNCYKQLKATSGCRSCQCGRDELEPTVYQQLLLDGDWLAALARVKACRGWLLMLQLQNGHNSLHACCCVLTDMPPCALRMRHPPRGICSICIMQAHG